MDNLERRLRSLEDGVSKLAGNIDQRMSIIINELIESKKARLGDLKDQLSFLDVPSRMTPDPRQRIRYLRYEIHRIEEELEKL